MVSKTGNAARARAEQRAMETATKRLAAEHRAQAALEERSAAAQQADALTQQAQQAGEHAQAAAATRSKLQDTLAQLPQARRKWLGEAAVALACLIGVVLYFVAFPGPQSPAARKPWVEQPLQLRLDEAIEKIPAGITGTTQKKSGR